MTVYPRAIGAFTALIAATTAFSAPADARRKEPAPIVYAGQGDRAAAPASAARGDTPRIVRRTLEFRYPDQPDTPIYKDIPVDSRDYASAAVAPRAAAPAPAVRQAAFQPAADPAYDEQGVASWYGDGFEGRPTANGEIFEASAMTAAHPTLPLPSLVHVVNLDNGREVVVRVNDRGPFEEGRLLDVSPRAADVLGFKTQRRANVRVRYLGPAPAAVQTASTPAAQSAPVEAISETPLQAAPRLTLTPAAAPQPQAAPAPRIAPAPAPTPIAYNPLPAPPRATHYVQVGAFADISNAQRLHARLASRRDVEIMPARVNGADYFRVVVGPVSTRDAAEMLRVRLQQTGLADGFVVALP